MPRLPFNTTCSIYRGPNHADAGDLVGVFDCRLVLENGIQQFAGQPNRLGWITIEVYAVEHGWTDDPLSYDPLLADRIAIPDDAEPQYQIWYADVINWKTQPEYDRLNIIAAIAAPEEPGDPGEDCPNAGLLVIDVETDIQTIGSGAEHWWQFSATPGTHRFILDVTVSGGDEVLIWQGDDCESLGSGPTLSISSSGVINLTLDPVSLTVLQVAGSYGP